jgi:hypothetical protein
VPTVDERDASSQRVVLVDAGTLAGWRRSAPSLAQLHQALLHLGAQHREERIAVLADPALKHQLPTAEQDDFDADIASGVLVCAPAGAVAGVQGFVAAVVAKAERAGNDVVLVTDRSYPFGRLASLRRDGARWIFDLDGAAAPARAVTAGANQRRRR